MSRRPKPHEIFTDAHHDAIGHACEKLWNGEPIENPIHSPRPVDHPLRLVANEAHDALNAVLAMRTAFLNENCRLRNQLRRARMRLPNATPAKAQ
jgi:hypothetical protein